MIFSILKVYLVVGLPIALIMTERKYPNEPAFGLKLLSVALITALWLPLWIVGGLSLVGKRAT